MGNKVNCGCECKNKMGEDELDLPVKQMEEKVKVASRDNNKEYNDNGIHNYNSNRKEGCWKGNNQKEITHIKKDNLEDDVQMNLFEDNKITFNENNNTNDNIDEHKYHMKEQSVKIDTSVNNNNNYNNYNVNSYEKDYEDDYEPKPKEFSIVLKQCQVDVPTNTTNNNINNIPQLYLNEHNYKQQELNQLQIEALRQNLISNTSSSNNNLKTLNTLNTKSTPKQYPFPLPNTTTSNLPNESTTIINNNLNLITTSLSLQKPSKPIPPSQTLISTSKNGYLASEMAYTDTLISNQNPNSIFSQYNLIPLPSPSLPSSPNDLPSFTPDISLINTFLIDVLFYSELLKLNNISKRKYISRFCVITKTNFKCFSSREKFITLQKAICSIDLTTIQKVSLFQFENETQCSNKKMKQLFHFIIIYNNAFEIFASENKEISNKFVCIINYYINELNNL